MIHLYLGQGPAIAQSVQRLATSCKARGIESRWGARFYEPVQTGPGAHPDSYTMGTGFFLGGKAAGAWR